MRNIIKWLSLPIIILVPVVTGVKTVKAQPVNPDKPNILFVMTDQQRFDALRRVQDELSVYNGRLKIRTPNLDRLSLQGAYFRNAYTPCAVCAPARTSLRTGCTIEHHGAQSNGLVEEKNYMKSPKLFQDKIEQAVTIDHILVEDRGYVSEYYGKWHMPIKFAYNKAGTERIIQFDDYNFENNSFTYVDPVSWDKQYAGYLDFFYKKGEISKTFPEGTQSNTFSKFPYFPVQYDLRYGYPTNTPLTSPPFASTTQPNVMGQDDLGEKYTPSGMNGFIGVQSLGRLCQQDKPFFLTLSFHNPHAPMVATKKYFDYYFDNRNDLLVPPNILDNLENSGYESGARQDPDKVHEWMACYYALVEEIDHWVGELLDTLDAYPKVRDNTIVVFTSDHGEMLGAHGLSEKNKFLEESAHVPLLIKAPGIEPGMVVDESVNTIDVFATLLDYSHASSFDHSDGKTLRRFIENTNYNNDFDEEHIVTEWDFRDPTGSSLSRSLGGEINFLSKKGPYKLILTKKASSSKIDMLYNIETDPYEMDNLVGLDGMTASNEVIGKAEHLKALLLDWMQRLDGPGKIYSDPKWNNYEGKGDMQEIRELRNWKKLNLWVGDTSVYFGSMVKVNDSFIRNEWFYLGRTTAGTTNVTSLAIEGSDADKFTLSGFTGGAIGENEYRKIKIQLTAPGNDFKITDARLRIKNDVGEDVIINLTNTRKSVNNMAPGSARLVYPGNNSKNINLNSKIEWLAGTNANQHKVYFGTTNPPPFVGTQNGSSFAPSYSLNQLTTYYWKVDEINDAGETKGTVWNFTTIDGTTGYNIVTQNNKFKLWPNPSQGTLTLQFEKMEDPVKVRLFDMIGNCVFDSIVNKYTNSLNLSNLSKGNYIVAIQNKNEKMTTIVMLE